MEARRGANEQTSTNGKIGWTSVSDSPGPVLSLAMICGDEGSKTIGRLLKSVIERPDGPFVDEIVIGWNGQSDDSLATQLTGFPMSELGKEPLSTISGTVGGVPTKVIRQKWEDDFAKSRNETYAAVTGEWIAFFDTDDILSSSLDLTSRDGLLAMNAMRRQLDQEELKPGGGGKTIREYLRGLPWDTNAIDCPYDYLINDNGDCLVRQRTRRIVRRSAGWIWLNRIHEALYLIGPVPEIARTEGSILLRHYPAADERKRLERNNEIIKSVELGDGPKDHRHAYDIFSMHAALGNWEESIKSLDDALKKASTKEDIYLYRMSKVSACLSANNTMLASQESLAAIDTWPERQEAYFAAGECAARRGSWSSVLAFFELGMKRKPLFDRVDFIASRCVNPRTRAAMAHCQLGDPERGVALCEEALRLLPSSPDAAQMLLFCLKDAKKKRGVDHAIGLVEMLYASQDLDTAESVIESIRSSPGLRGITSIARFQMLEANANAMRCAFDLAKPDQAWIDGLSKNATEHRATVDARPGGGALVDAKSMIESHHGKGSQVLSFHEHGGDKAVLHRQTTKRPLTFYCPVGVIAWDPTFPDMYGIGGSETSAVMLARELGSRGYPITMYCPGGEDVPNASNNIVWYGLRSFVPAEQHDTIIACRAPHIVRNPELSAKTFIWHQDNGYASRWLWNEDVDRRSAGSLHVSEWARQKLISELTGRDYASTRENHIVIGNGIVESWVWSRLPRDKRPERTTHRVIFASDPTRGLDTLLNCWPHVREAVPDAELEIYCDFDSAWRISTANVGLASGNVPTVAALWQKMQASTKEGLGVKFVGKVAHNFLSERMFSAGVYAYPGGLMPEGFGVALVQAEAAGLAVIHPDSGALPEVLNDRTYKTPPVLTNDAANIFLELLIDALLRADETIDREANSEAAWRRHSWSLVADRFEKAIGAKT